MQRAIRSWVAVHKPTRSYLSALLANFIAATAISASFSVLFIVMALTEAHTSPKTAQEILILYLVCWGLMQIFFGWFVPMTLSADTPAAAKAMRLGKSREKFLQQRTQEGWHVARTYNPIGIIWHTLRWLYRHQ